MRRIPFDVVIDLPKSRIILVQRSSAYVSILLQMRPRCPVEVVPQVCSVERSTADVRDAVQTGGSVSHVPAPTAAIHRHAARVGAADPAALELRTGDHPPLTKVVPVFGQRRTAVVRRQ